MGDLAYIDGMIVPLGQAKISVLDRGFLYGDGLFETIRVYQKVPFLLENHLKRLLGAAETLKINGPDASKINAAIESVLAQSEIGEGILKIILTRGIGERGLPFSPDLKATLMIILTSGIPYTEEMYSRGFSALFLPDKRSLPNLKSLSLLANVMAGSHVHDQGAGEAFFLKDGSVTEGTMSNIFAVKKGKLATPSLAQGILPGITRAHLLELAGNLGTDVSETSLKTEELQNADEIFITNSIIEIMPIVGLQEEPVGKGSPGDVTLALREKYQESVRDFIAKHSRR
jgi:D-amino acid aminotransferase